MSVPRKKWVSSAVFLLLSLSALFQVGASRDNILRRDEKGRPVLLSGPNGTNIALAYDDAGRVIRKTWIPRNQPRNQRVRSYVYDGEGRLIVEIDSRGRTKQFSLGPAGEILHEEIEKDFISEREEESLLQHVPGSF